MAVTKPCAQGGGLKSRWEGERETRDDGPVLTLLEGTFSAGAQVQKAAPEAEAEAADELTLRGKSHPLDQGTTSQPHPTWEV